MAASKTMIRQMKIHLSLFAYLLATLAFAQAPNLAGGGVGKQSPALVPIEDVAGLPRVLIIGDSISIGYTIATRELLKDVANVHRIPVNGSATHVGLRDLDAWLATDRAGKKWDLIHFNWGLHDLKHFKDGKLDLSAPQVNPVKVYENNLRKIVARMKQTGAKLIFATTTPVSEGSAGRVARSELAYNEAALRVMKAEGVAVNDLHSLAATKLGEIQIPRNVHFTPAGYQLLAGQVAAEIKKLSGSSVASRSFDRALLAPHARCFTGRAPPNFSPRRKSEPKWRPFFCSFRFQGR
ncbi:MAG: hypothetical protein RIQ93_2296 [Verrucomicrobiota bacterium]|jgi:acyl-CoA thioesterase-1